MATKRAPPEKAESQNEHALERWDNEGGTTSRLGSEALIAKLKSLAPTELQVLQCLGAAVVLEWNELPTDVQRILFKLASADAATDAAGELPERIARFLHDHKDDESA